MEDNVNETCQGNMLIFNVKYFKANKYIIKS